MRIAIMPARGGSKRIPYKNIVDFCGKPLLTHALITAKTSELFDLIHVSTEDATIASVAAQAGFAPEFARDAALSDDTTPLFPVLKWVLDTFAARGRQFDTVCLLMPTAPLIEPADLIEANALYERYGGSRSVLATAPFPCPVEWAYRQSADGTLTAREPGQDQIRSQDLAQAYYDTGIFIFLPASTVRGYPGVAPQYVGYPISRAKAVDIDNPEDLELARLLWLGRQAAQARSAS